MTEPHTFSAQNWADLVAQGYAAEATPPLTPELLESVRVAVREAGLDRSITESPGENAVERVNRSLDAFELELGVVVGPRLATLDAGAIPAFVQRSEGGRPLRAFGGQ